MSDLPILSTKNIKRLIDEKCVSGDLSQSGVQVQNNPAFKSRLMSDLSRFRTACLQIAAFFLLLTEGKLSYDPSVTVGKLS